MKKSAIVNRIHTGIIIYSLFGWLFKSQRNILLLLLPTLQYQFLVNDNNCVLTQLENKFLKEENKDKKEDDEEIIYDSFIGEKLKQYNINISEKQRELLIHSSVYGSFIISYFLSCF